MNNGKESKKKRSGQQSSRKSDGRVGGGGKKKRRSWLATHGRDLRFLVLFGILMGAYYFLSTTTAMKDQFFPWYLEATAKVSGAAVHLFGYDEMVIRGNALIEPRGSISVERGCDAIAPTALFVATVLASPVPLMSRFSAAMGGCLLLMVINVVRIISLFLTRVHWKSAFDVMHLDVWQSAFILLAIVLWMVWATWESRRRKKRKASDHAAAASSP